MKTFTIPKDLSGTPLGAALATLLGCSKRKAKGLLDSKSVSLNGRKVWIASHPLVLGDELRVEGEIADTTSEKSATANASEIEVLYKDGQFLVINKPAELLSNGPDSAEAALRTQLGSRELLAAHRLDRDTSGCLLIARTAKYKELIEEEFRQKRVAKKYAALVLGRVPDGLHRIDSPLDRKEAITLVTVTDRLSVPSEISTPLTQLRVEILTGRMHQIRRHLSSAGHMVVGDKEYGSPPPPDVPTAPRQMLHAAELTLLNPVTKQRISVKAPLPGDMKEFMGKLKRI